MTKKDWKQSLVGILLIVGCIALSTLFLNTDYPYLFGVVLVIIFLVIGFFETSKIKFCCPTCGTQFFLTNMQDAPHGETKIKGQFLEWKLLKCPQCKKQAKMYHVKSPSKQKI